MKTIATIFFIFFIGTAAQAQNNTTDVKVETVEMTIVTETVKELNLETKTEVARLYKFKNARVTKALSFTTKRNKAKMA
jgi:pyruvate/2-oxoglutarate dehydrogenase complex dihydrolipoamide acyltransferase (E2) component